MKLSYLFHVMFYLIKSNRKKSKIKENKKERKKKKGKKEKEKRNTK